VEAHDDIEEFWRLARRFEVANTRYIEAAETHQARLAPPPEPLLEALGEEWPTMGRSYLPIHLSYRRYCGAERERVVTIAEEWFAAQEACDEAGVVMQLSSELTAVEEERDRHADAFLRTPCCSLAQVLARAEIIDHLAWPSALEKLHQDILEVGGLPITTSLDQRMDGPFAPQDGVGAWGRRYLAWWRLSWLRGRSRRSLHAVQDAYAVAKPSPPDCLFVEFTGGRELMAPDRFTPRDAPLLIDYLRLSGAEAEIFIAAWQAWAAGCEKWRRRLGVSAARRADSLTSRAATAAYSRLVTTPIDGGLSQLAMLVEAAAWFDHPVLWGHLARRAREAAHQLSGSPYRLI
jgi:hypothetical protein